VPERLDAHVLLVEDNDKVRAFTQQVLEDMGCVVLLASNGSDAVALPDATRVDLVLTDVVMPGMSGIELADAIRERWPTLPVILATGYSDELVAKRPEFPSIAKPFTSADLQDAIASALQS
jgi:CheY-like chemotaxis protein